VALWRTPPRWTMGTLALIGAPLLQAFATFGDSPATRVIAGLFAAIIGLRIAWAYLVLPLLAWRRGRWPVEAMTLEPIAMQPWSTDARKRVQALEALGFVARLQHTRAEGKASGLVVLLTHPGRAVLAKVAAFTVGEYAHAATSLMTFFPAPASTRILLFENADAAMLLRHFDALDPRKEAGAAPTDDELRAYWNADIQWQERCLVDAGYLDSRIDHGARRYTLKGGFTSVWRMLWPLAALERVRQIRAAREVLRPT